MINKDTIEKLVTDELEGSAHYLVDVRVSASNKIFVVLDSDDGLTIDDCVRISRCVEGKFDRDVEDYELNVTTYGIDQPLLTLRQYRKYIGRDVKVEMEDGRKFKGELLAVNDGNIRLQPELPASKTKLKKMSDEEKQAQILDFEEIKTAKCVISFK